MSGTYSNPGERRFARPYSAKTVFFYKDGDEYFTGLRLPITKIRYRNMDALLDRLNESIDLPYGVRCLHTPHGGTPIRSIDDLYHMGKYVASSSKVARGVDVDALERRKRERVLLPYPFARAHNATLLNNTSSAVMKKPNESASEVMARKRAKPSSVPRLTYLPAAKQMYFVLNGQPATVYRTVLNPLRRGDDLDALIAEVSVGLGVPVARLHAFDNGARVRNVAQLLALKEARVLAVPRHQRLVVAPLPPLFSPAGVAKDERGGSGGVTGRRHSISRMMNKEAPDDPSRSPTASQHFGLLHKTSNDEHILAPAQRLTKITMPNSNSNSNSNTNTTIDSDSGRPKSIMELSTDESITMGAPRGAKQSRATQEHATDTTMRRQSAGTVIEANGSVRTGQLFRSKSLKKIVEKDSKDSKKHKETKKSSQQNQTRVGVQAARDRVQALHRAEAQFRNPIESQAQQSQSRGIRKNDWILSVRNDAKEPAPLQHAARLAFKATSTEHWIGRRRATPPPGTTVLKRGTTVTGTTRGAKFGRIRSNTNFSKSIVPDESDEEADRDPMDAESARIAQKTRARKDSIRSMEVSNASNELEESGDEDDDYPESMEMRNVFFRRYNIHEPPLDEDLDFETLKRISTTLVGKPDEKDHDQDHSNRLAPRRDSSEDQDDDTTPNAIVDLSRMHTIREESASSPENRSRRRSSHSLRQLQFNFEDEFGPRYGNSAAVLIQKYVRGYLTRKKLKLAGMSPKNRANKANGTNRLNGSNESNKVNKANGPNGSNGFNETNEINEFNRSISTDTVASNSNRKPRKSVTVINEPILIRSQSPNDLEARSERARSPPLSVLRSPKTQSPDEDEEENEHEDEKDQDLDQDINEWKKFDERGVDENRTSKDLGSAEWRADAAQLNETRHIAECFESATVSSTTVPSIGPTIGLSASSSPAAIIACKGFVYSITVKTGNRWAADTEADLSLVMYGSQAQSERIVLRQECVNWLQSSSPKFRQNQTDSFRVELPTRLGLIQRITVSHQHVGYGAGIFIEHILITEMKDQMTQPKRTMAKKARGGTSCSDNDEDEPDAEDEELDEDWNEAYMNPRNAADGRAPSRQFLFLCNKWLDSGQADGKLERSFRLAAFCFPTKAINIRKRTKGRWEFIFHGGNSIGQGGTTSNLRLIGYGTRGQSTTCGLYDTRMKTAPSESLIQVDFGNIGDLLKVRVELDGTGPSPDFFLSHVVMRDLDTGERFVTMCGRWLRWHSASYGAQPFRELLAFHYGVESLPLISYEGKIRVAPSKLACFEPTVQMEFHGDLGETGLFTVSIVPEASADKENAENHCNIKHIEISFKVETVSIGRVYGARIFFKPTKIGAQLFEGFCTLQSIFENRLACSDGESTVSDWLISALVLRESAHIPYRYILTHRRLVLRESPDDENGDGEKHYQNTGQNEIGDVSLASSAPLYIMDLMNSEMEGVTTRAKKSAKTRNESSNWVLSMLLGAGSTLLPDVVLCGERVEKSAEMSVLDPTPVDDIISYQLKTKKVNALRKVRVSASGTRRLNASAASTLQRDVDFVLIKKMRVCDTLNGDELRFPSADVQLGPNSVYEFSAIWPDVPPVPIRILTGATSALAGELIVRVNLRSQHGEIGRRVLSAHASPPASAVNPSIGNKLLQQNCQSAFELEAVSVGELKWAELRVDSSEASFVWECKELLVIDSQTQQNYLFKFARRFSARQKIQSANAIRL